MTVTVRCWCGWEYEVGESAANSFGRCPQEGCRAWVRIPPEPLLHQFLGNVVDASTLEASMPDLRKQGARAEWRPAAPARPAPAAAEAAPAVTALASDDLPVMTIEEPRPAAGQGDDFLPILTIEPPAVSVPSAPPSPRGARPGAAPK